MINLNYSFANSLDKDPVYVSLRDKEFGMFIFDVKPPIITPKLTDVIEQGASLFAVKLTEVKDLFGNRITTVHGVITKDFHFKKVEWVRFSEHCKSQICGNLEKAVENKIITKDDWVYFLIGKSVHYVFLNGDHKE